MTTVWGFSPRGAVKIYMRKYKPKKGGAISAKPRGHGEWHEYEVL